MDSIATSSGDLAILCVGHATLVLTWSGTVVHIDPWGDLTDYAVLPKADLILVTHEHFDHLDPEAIRQLRTEGTVVIASPAAAARIAGAVAVRNGEKSVRRGVEIEAVPAYNIRHMRSPGKPFHPKGEGNGYVVGFGGTRVYIAGDTENTPEMKALSGIDVAFLPMNLPYTMTPEMVADAARAFRPRILYPYHFGESDTAALERLLAGSGIEVRIRSMK
jgi:L-ascorbate metabolism protein UlaG (beta-lactamase superfamily)